uniref:Uncharacterized protein n=1 Tax=Plectus sambesii TaxID=2011161 RepID=A0A914XJF0_9BILA
DGLSSPDAAKEQPSNAEQIPQESAASKSDAEAPTEGAAPVGAQSDAQSENVRSASSSLTAQARATVEGESPAEANAGGNAGAPEEESGGFAPIEIATDKPKVIWPPGVQPIQP